MKGFRKFLEVKQWTEKDLSRLPIDKLDQMAFGIQQGVHEFPVNNLHIKWHADWESVHQQQRESGMSPQNWARQFPLDEPIDVILENEKFYVDDGHHRYLAAQTLKRPMIPGNLVIKDNPVLAILKKQESI